MATSPYLNTIICSDALSFLPKLKESSVDVVVTDPPYFLDKLDNNWNQKTVSRRLTSQLVVRSLPAGMKFDREQGRRFYEWYKTIASQLFRVLKPGGFFFSFSSPRLYHRMASAVDDAGFEVRDMFLWLYTQNQVKAMGLNHFIKKMACGQKERQSIADRLSGWKTPQVKSCFEPIVMAQRPTESTYLQNMISRRVGLVNMNIRIGENMHPANIASTNPMHAAVDKAFLLPKPSKEEKGAYNFHETVKPLALCEYLISLTAFAADAVVLDPFVGSGTVALAAKRLGKSFVGVDVNESYVRIARRRVGEQQRQTLVANSHFFPSAKQHALPMTEFPVFS